MPSAPPITDCSLTLPDTRCQYAISNRFDYLGWSRDHRTSGAVELSDVFPLRELSNQGRFQGSYYCVAVAIDGSGQVAIFPYDYTDVVFRHYEKTARVYLFSHLSGSTLNRTPWRWYYND